MIVAGPGRAGKNHIPSHNFQHFHSFLSEILQGMWFLPARPGSAKITSPQVCQQFAALLVLRLLGLGLVSDGSPPLVGVAERHSDKFSDV